MKFVPGIWNDLALYRARKINAILFQTLITKVVSLPEKKHLKMPEDIFFAIELKQAFFSLTALETVILILKCIPFAVKKPEKLIL